MSGPTLEDLALDLGDVMNYWITDSYNPEREMKVLENIQSRLTLYVNKLKQQEKLK